MIFLAILAGWLLFMAVALRLWFVVLSGKQDATEGTGPWY